MGFKEECTGGQFFLSKPNTQAGRFPKRMVVDTPAGGGKQRTTVPRGARSVSRV